MTVSHEFDATSRALACHQVPGKVPVVQVALGTLPEHFIALLCKLFDRSRLFLVPEPSAKVSSTDLR